MTKTISCTLAALAIVSLALTGCGNGQDRNTATVKASASVPSDVTKAKQELDQVQSSLKAIQATEQGDDLKKLYADLKSRSSSLTSSLGDVSSSSQSTIEAGKKQISEWHEQANGFTDADLRNASNKREGDLRTAVEALSASNERYKGASETYRSQLSQTLTALDLDLSQPGVTSAKNVIAKLVDDDMGLRGSLSDVAEKSRELTKVVNPQ